MNAVLILPEILMILMGCVILVLDLFYRLNTNSFKALSVLALVFAIVLKANFAYDTAFYSLFVFDEVAKYSSILINALAIYFLFANTRANEGEFFAIFLFMMACFNFLVSSNNLIMIFISLEGSSLALYTLIAFKKKAVDASLKYLSCGMLASAFFAFGVALNYYDSGSLEISKGNVLSFAMIFTMILFKLSIMPFHGWLRDVYNLANSTLAGFISVVPKLAILVIAYKLYGFNNFILLIASFSMLIASIFALKENDAKGLLVYSSISHSSFAFIISGTFFGFFYYFLAFAFVNIALFMFLGVFKTTSYDKIGGVFKRYKFLGFAIIIILLNLAAIPPFGVFFAKVIALKIVLEMNVVAAICMAISSIIMLIAYLKFIRVLLSDSECEFLYLTNTQKVVLIFAVILSFIVSFGVDFVV